jgi:hypothetical protein
VKRRRKWWIAALITVGVWLIGTRGVLRSRRALRLVSTLASNGKVEPVDVLVRSEREGMVARRWNAATRSAQATFC